MNKNILLGLVILIIIIGVAMFFAGNRGSQQYTSQPQVGFQNVNNQQEVSGEEEAKEKQLTQENKETTYQEVQIIITDNGFEPSTITVSKGTKVTFVNQFDSPSWPASDVHPTHRVYPGSGIEKCGTPQESSIFDACHGLQKGESYSFIFNEAGEWKYHDHLRPYLTGTIIVK
ncbi:hypothetical protein HRbin34_00504 [bacterium HR34]|nr:hypothetical protein HRbin34_00504 [bacterium HR34]